MSQLLSSVLVTVRRALIVLGLSGLAGVLLAGIALPVVAGLGISAREGADAFSDMSSQLEAGPMAERSKIVDKDGKTIAAFYNENRVYVELDKISDPMKQAILAIEDDRFFERGPIDLQGTLRAFINNMQAGRTTGGGSTLTQQYVKQVRLSQAETKEEQAAVLASSGIDGYKRKLQELRMAVSVEQELEKDEILERYLNIVYFGNGAYGVQAAARTYFDKPAKKLKVGEAAMLAGLVQNPLQYDPTENSSAARNRRDVVINRMIDTGRISQEKGRKTKNRDLEIDVDRVDNGCVDSWAGYFCDYVVNEIKNMKKLGDTAQERIETLRTGGLRIETTLDEDAQRAAAEAVSEQVAPGDSAIASLASIDPDNGYIRAMANSREYGVDDDKKGVSNLNYAVDWDMGGGSGIQPGSSFKPFVLAAAVEKGIDLGYTMNAPSPMGTYGWRWKTCDRKIGVERGWNPVNSTGPEGGGEFNLRTATQQSINTFYIKLSQKTGLCRPARIAEESGVHRANAGQMIGVDDDGDPITVPEELEQVPSFTLGVNLVSPLSMASGYSTFANDGKNCKKTGIYRIKDRTGDVVIDHSDPKCKRVLDEDDADKVKSVLRSVMTDGTGRGVQLDDHWSGGKTGTTNDGVAVWFVGFTSDYATAVAVADVDGKLTSLDGRTFNGRYVPIAYGSTLAGPVWQEYMNAMH